MSQLPIFELRSRNNDVVAATPSSPKVSAAPSPRRGIAQGLRSMNFNHGGEGAADTSGDEGVAATLAH